MGTGIFTEWPLVPYHRGWPRRLAPPDGWRSIGEALRAQELTLLGLWGDGGDVHAALLERDTGLVTIASLAAAGGRAPSLGVFHPPAIRLERALQDLHGIQFTALPDPRPWLDHGRWQCAAPLAVHPGPPLRRETAFLGAEGPALHQIAVGPVHAGTIEPGHFRFTAHGETVVRLEERLGYAHKGIERLIQGREVRAAGPIAARVSGDSTVAYSWAFSLAVETALGVEAPPRATWLRAIMAELERIANHLGDIGAVCNDAAFTLMHNECGILREQVLRTADSCFGHRLMMDRIVPGGVTCDLDTGQAASIRSIASQIARRLPELHELYDNTASLQDRTVGSGILHPALAAQFACGGFVGRASGRDFDARRDLAYAPYDVLAPEVTGRTAGDVDARVRVRMAEVRASTVLLDRLLDNLPAGPIVRAELPAPEDPVEATAVVEGFRGDILAFVRLDRALHVQRCHLRDPSWFQWPVLETAIEANIVADFPLCNKSFNCSYSGHDL